MGIQETLQNIGLTNNEIKIYLALLETGQTTTGPLIKKTKVHTSKVYDALERLQDKGLASYITKAKTKHFKAVSPKRILDFLNEKKQTIAKQEKQVKKILPELELMQEIVDDSTKAEVFKGWKGMRTVYAWLQKELKKGETNYVFGAGLGEDQEKTRNFFTHHVNALAKKRCKMKIIYNESARGNIKANLKHKGLFEVKHLENTTPAEINIWKNNVMIVILRKEPTVILINDKKVAASFLQYFNVMWMLAKP